MTTRTVFWGKPLTHLRFLEADAVPALERFAQGSGLVLMAVPFALQGMNTGEISIAQGNQDLFALGVVSSEVGEDRLVALGCLVAGLGSFDPTSGRNADGKTMREAYVVGAPCVARLAEATSELTAEREARDGR